MKIEEVRELIKIIDQSSVDEFEFEKDGTKISMKKHTEVTGQPVSVAPDQRQASFSKPAEMEPKLVESNQAEAPNQPTSEKQDQENLHKIESPMVGTFYVSPSPDDEAYVSVGDKVKADSVVCIVEAMKLFNEIEADQAGEIVEILVENGQLVEYGQPLFLLKPGS